MTEAQKEYVITEELAELIEGQLKNEHCKKCPYEGAGVNSGILANLRMRKVTRMSGGNLLVDKPAKSDDAVLDELEKDILEVKKDLNLQLPCKTAKDLAITLALIGELQWVLVRIAELRQQKER